MATRMDLHVKMAASAMALEMAVISNPVWAQQKSPGKNFLKRLKAGLIRAATPVRSRAMTHPDTIASNILAANVRRNEILPGYCKAGTNIKKIRRVVRLSLMTPEDRERATSNIRRRAAS